MVSFLWHIFLNLEKFILVTIFLTRVTKFRFVTNNFSCRRQHWCRWIQALIIKMLVLKWNFYLQKNEANVPSENRKSFQSCKRSFIWYSFGFNPCFKILTSSISIFFFKIFSLNWLKIRYMLQDLNPGEFRCILYGNANQYALMKR